VVSVQSAKWGKFKGIAEEEQRGYISHVDIISQHILSGVYRFNARRFYVELVHELKEMGF